MIDNRIASIVVCLVLGCICIQPVNGQKRAGRCDFSEYHPLRLSDWPGRRGVVKRVEPVYPLEAKRKHIHGKVSVRVLVNRNGEVEQACGMGQPLLRQAAEDAARQWVLRVPKLNGTRIPYLETTLEFNFVLDTAPAQTYCHK